MERVYESYQDKYLQNSVFIAATHASNRYTQMLEIKRPGKASFGPLHCPNEALMQASRYRPWLKYRHFCRYHGISGLAGLVYNDERKPWKCLHCRPALPTA